MRKHFRAWRQSMLLMARPRAAEALPVTLDRRRIYVLPTRFGLFVGVLLSAMLLGALNYNNNPALMLALLLATAAIASTVFAHLQLAGLRLQAISAEPVAAGTPLRLRLALARHDARARRGLQLQVNEVHAYTSLDSSAATEVDLDLPTCQRGWLDTERIRVATTQPLGLARAWAWFWPDVALLVYPTPEPHGPPLPPQPGAAATTRPHPQGDELQQLRPYRAGDAMHAIAWKHSARRDSLLAREYEQPIATQLELQWRALTMLPYEQRIARLAHWVDEAERQGRPYRLHLPGQAPIGPGHGPGQRHLCLRALALLPHG